MCGIKLTYSGSLQWLRTFQLSRPLLFTSKLYPHLPQFIQDRWDFTYRWLRSWSFLSLFSKGQTWKKTQTHLLVFFLFFSFAISPRSCLLQTDVWLLLFCIVHRGSHAHLSLQVKWHRLGQITNIITIVTSKMSCIMEPTVLLWSGELPVVCMILTVGFESALLPHREANLGCYLSSAVTKDQLISSWINMPIPYLDLYVFICIYSGLNLDVE